MLNYTLKHRCFYFVQTMMTVKAMENTHRRNRKMKNRMFMNLQFFADGGEGGTGGDQGGNVGTQTGGNSNHATYSYEQAEEIANARAQRAEQAALKSYFQQQGMSQEEVTQALADYRQKKQSQQPNVSAIQKERDDALAKVTQYENEKILVGKGVKQEDIDYVVFKVNKLVTDKKGFKTAAEEYLKENPRFTGQTYKMSTGATTGNASSGTEAKNEAMNNMIRNAFRR